MGIPGHTLAADRFYYSLVFEGLKVSTSGVMAKSTAVHDVGEGPPSSARECAVQAIEKADEPVQPAELADEYGCSAGHMRNTLRDLMDEGEIIRIDRGQYVDASAGAAEMDTEDTGDDSEGFDAPGSAESESETMPTDEEYQKQHDRDRDESDGEDEEADDDQDGEKPAIEEDEIANVDGTSGAAGAAAAGAAGLSLLGDRDGVNVWLIVGVVALGVVVYMMVSSDGSDGSDGEPDQEPEQDQEVVQQSGGGLRG
jgi:hypothetical protein